jgi:hypothetical protein
MKTNVDIFNDVTYKHAKNLYEILFIVGYTKIKIQLKFGDLKIYILVLFLYSPKYKVLEHDFFARLRDK